MHFTDLKDTEGQRHVLGLSGGKDSAALAVYIKDKYPELSSSDHRDEKFTRGEKFLSRMGVFFRHPKGTGQATLLNLTGL